MTETNKHKEFINTNDKYNLTHICMGFDETMDSRAIEATLKEELPKVVNEKIQDSDIWIKTVCQKKTKDYHVNVEFRTDLSSKTCLTIIDWMCRKFTEVHDITLTSYVCFWPEHVWDDTDETPITDPIKVPMMYITWWHGNSDMHMSKLPFYYFTFLKEEFCDADEEWSQVHVDQIAYTLHTNSKETNTYKIFTPDGDGGSLDYLLDVAKMRLYVFMTAKEARKFERMFDKDSGWLEQVASFEVEPLLYPSDDNENSEIGIVIELYGKRWIPEDRMQLIDWFLHNFDVKRISGEGYAYVKPKLEGFRAEMEVEKYRYQKGNNQMGAATFCCINPDLIWDAGQYGERCICQLVGDALSESAFKSSDVETMYILARPPKN